MTSAQKKYSNYFNKGAIAGLCAIGIAAIGLVIPFAVPFVWPAAVAVCGTSMAFIMKATDTIKDIQQEIIENDIEKHSMNIIRSSSQDIEISSQKEMETPITLHTDKVMQEKSFSRMSTHLR